MERILLILLQNKVKQNVLQSRVQCPFNELGELRYLTYPINVKSLDIWLLAAYYQFEMNNNPFKARKMFLKALKINSDKREFWLEYFRFELKFLQKLKERQNILGIEQEKNKQADNDESDKESIGSFLEEEKDQEEKVFQIRSGKESSNDKINEEFISFEDNNANKGLKSDQNDSLVLVVYESMMENFPEDKSITSDALQICSEFQGEWIEEIRKNIFKASRKQFSKNPSANLRSILEMESINQASFEKEQSQNLVSNFKRAVKAIKKYLDELRGEYQNDLKFSEEKQNMILELHKILIDYYRYLQQIRKDETKTFLEFYSMIIKSLIADDIKNKKYFPLVQDVSELCIKNNELIPELKEIIQTQYTNDPQDYRLLEVLANITISIPSQDIIQGSILAKSIQTCLKTRKMDIPHDIQTKLWIHLIDLTNVFSKEAEEVCAFLKESIKYLAFTNYFNAFVEKFLQKILLVRQIQDLTMTEVFKILFNMKSACPVEASAIYIKELLKVNPKDQKIKQHLIKATEWHPHNKDLWIELIRWEKSFGNPIECADIFTRAQRFIKDSSFLTEYTNILQE